jgi:type III secretion protein Q
MKSLILRKVDANVAALTRQLGIGVRLTFSVGQEPVELTLRPLLDAPPEPQAMQCFNSALGPFALSEAESVLSLLGELPVTLAGEHQPWYWQMLNQRLSPVIAELLSPLEPHSDNTALSGDALPNAMTCRIQVQRGNHSLQGLIRAEAKTLSRWLHAAPWQADRQPLDEQWPIRQPLELGRLSLTLDQLAALQPGDVLLPPDCHFDSHGNGLLQLGARLWAVHTDSHERQLYVRLSHEENPQHGQPGAV